MQLYADKCEPGFQLHQSFIDASKTIDLVQTEEDGDVSLNVWTNVMENLMASDGSCAPTCTLMDTTCSSDQGATFSNGALTFAPTEGGDQLCVKCHLSNGGKTYAETETQVDYNLIVQTGPVEEPPTAFVDSFSTETAIKGEVQ